MNPIRERTDVLIVGGGPAGAAVATRLAAAGADVTIVERTPRWQWRACGVFSSPTTLVELRRLGLTNADIEPLARSIPRLWVQSPGGARFALRYGWQREGDATAVGFDRSRLDPLLLQRAADAGVDMQRGATAVTFAAHDDGTWRVGIRASGGDREVHARILVGADGVRSAVAREVGVARDAFLPRVGLTYHVAEVGDPPAAEPGDGRMVVLRGAYCGLAPVPGRRVNVGIVLGAKRRRADLRRDGAHATADGVLQEAGATAATPLDAIAGIAPVAHRVARRSGRNWLLVGDAAGFLDPFTGEGLHRALVSARLAADAIQRSLAGPPHALRDYDAAMEARFRGKDLVSLVVQAFVTQPALFEYVARRLATRDVVRDRLGLLMGDLVPASAGFDPRFLASLLAP